MTKELWHITLERLRAQFEAGAQKYPSISCVMIHSGPGERCRLNDIPIPISDNRFVEGGFSAYLESRPLDPNTCTWRRWYYDGDPVGVKVFRNLATDSGRCVDANTLTQLGVPDPSIRAKAFQQWLWAIFDLAWQGIPGSALNAERIIWDTEQAGYTTFPYDAVSLRGLVRVGVYGGKSSFLQKWADKLPTYFCSKLADVFMASVYTTDILLDGISPTNENQQMQRRNQSGAHGIDSNSKIEAIRTLENALHNYINDNMTGSGYLGDYPAITQDHAVYRAVLTVEQHYPDAMLPVRPRLVWVKLLEVSKSPGESHDPGYHASDLAEWSSREREQLFRELDFAKRTQVDWRDVRERLQRLQSRGEKYTSQRDLAKRLKCSESTINKAIQASPTLRAWMAEGRGATPRATHLNEVVTDSVPQKTEGDPSDEPTNEEVDKVMARLIERAEDKPEERAMLNALNAEGRRVLVAAYYDHEADEEPSPLEDDPPDRRARKVKQYKHV